MGGVVGGVVGWEGAGRHSEVEAWTLTTHYLLPTTYYHPLTTHHEAEEWSFESRWVPTDCCSV